jgi:diacylglycerol kinase (ATP)
MKYQVIVNPIAGRGFGARSTPTIRRLLSEHDLDFDLVSTTYPGEATDLARRAVLDGYDVVVAAGGDGTYHEVINGMAAAHDEKMPADGTIGTLGVLPVGSGSDLCYSVGVPGELEAACARLAQGEPKVVDLGRVTVYESEQDPGTRRYFDNTVGIGFDGVVTLEGKKIKYLRGMALYLPVVLKTVFVSLKPPRAVIEYEEAPEAPTPTLPPVGRPSSVGVTGGTMRRIEKTVLMATICNGPREGGGFYVAPDARNDDGLFDILLADNLPRVQILALIPHFMKGTHVDKPSVTMLRSRRIVITSPDPLIAHADGEMLCTEGHRIECEIAAQRVQVIG